LSDWCAAPSENSRFWLYFLGFHKVFKSVHFDEIRKLEREGKLAEYSLSELQEMRRDATGFLQSGNYNADFGRTLTSLDIEIQRKEAQEARLQSEAVAQMLHKQASQAAIAIHQEAMSESRRSTHYARSALWVAALAAAISLAAWIFPRAAQDRHPTSEAGSPQAEPQQPALLPSIASLPTNLPTASTAAPPLQAVALPSTNQP